MIDTTDYTVDMGKKGFKENLWRGKKSKRLELEGQTKN